MMNSKLSSTSSHPTDDLEAQQGLPSSETAANRLNNNLTFANDGQLTRVIANDSGANLHSISQSGENFLKDLLDHFYPIKW